MLTAGDEFGRTQQGNNNAYVQDNELSWLDWQQAASPAGQRQSAFVGRLMALRQELPALRAQRPADSELRAAVAAREAGGSSRRDAIAAVADEYGLKKRDVYTLVHAAP